MTDKKIVQIRESISAAQQLDPGNKALGDFVGNRMEKLEAVLAFPNNSDALDCLVNFVCAYIMHVPDFLEALQELAVSAGIEEHTHVFLDIATDYFIDPPEQVSDHFGLHRLIDKAYLAHRLFEEINDRIALICGFPLTPMDMTMSNIIIHEILGDTFANQLDLAVHYSIESLFQTGDVANNSTFLAYAEKYSKAGWEDALEKWPCLGGDSALSLTLDSFPTLRTRH